MDFDGEYNQDEAETGSDELLSDDNLRLPDSANPLVRLHAIRAWLARRQKETGLHIGTLALDLQQLQQEYQGWSEAPDKGKPLRRRELQARQDRIQSVQDRFQSAQQLLDVYEDAERLLEDCVNHTTVSERLLVEYYLMMEQLVEEATEECAGEQTVRVAALSDVLQRIEQVGAPHEGD